MQPERPGHKGFFAEPVLRFLPQQAPSAFPVHLALVDREKSDPDSAKRD